MYSPDHHKDTLTLILPIQLALGTEGIHLTELEMPAFTSFPKVPREARSKIFRRRNNDEYQLYSQIHILHILYSIEDRRKKHKINTKF